MNINIEISYDRKSKEYQWVDPRTGEVYTFDKQEKTSGKAFQFALAMLDPDLYQCACNILAETPQLERVVWKAAELVATNKVEVFQPLPHGDVIAMVDSSDGFGRYAIQHDNGYITCQCKDFVEFGTMDRHGAKWCKHKMATHIWQLLYGNETTESDELPF